MKKIIVIILILMIGLSTVGCSEKEPEKIKFGVMSDVGAVPFLIADKMGFYEEVGVDVEINVFRSAVDRDTALQTGNLDGAMADMLTIFFYEEANMDFKMTSDTYGNYRVITSPSLTEESFKELDEIEVGLSSNTVIDFSTDIVFDHLGIKDKLKKVAIPQMPVRLEMLYSDSLNGSTLPEPLAFSAVNQGGVVIGDTERFGLYPAIVLFNNETLENNSNGVDKLYEGYNMAVEYLNDTDKDEYYNYLVEDLGFPEEIKDDFIFPKFKTKNPPDEHTFDVVSEWMLENELISQKYDYSDLSY
ncbi:MAG: ABC transporter substrate-binding protein [Bacillota bacterium]|nr:ABC transporter substrate-binding protein [Bacillota bacterium]